MPSLKCEIHGEATREYLACIQVMLGGPISLFQEATEHTPSRDGQAGWPICSECTELDEEPLLASTTLICGNCADRLMEELDLSGDRLGFPFSSAGFTRTHFKTLLKVIMKQAT